MRVLILLLTAIFWSGFTVTASAEQHTVVDETGRVWAYADGEWTRSAWTVGSDVERVTLAHRDRALVFRAQYVALGAASPEGDLEIDLQTANGRRYEVVLFIWSDGESAEGYLAGADGVPQRCRGMRSAAHFGRDQISLRLPTRCLERPRSVRFRVEAGAYDRDYQYFRDVAPGRGHRMRVWSPRVGRG